MSTTTATLGVDDAGTAPGHHHGHGGRRPGDVHRDHAALTQAIAAGSIVDVGGTWFTVGADIGTTAADLADGSTADAPVMVSALRWRPPHRRPGRPAVAGATVVVDGISFTVAAPGAFSGATTIPVVAQSLTSPIPAGATVLDPVGAAVGATSIPVETQTISSPIASGTAIPG